MEPWRSGTPWFRPRHPRKSRTPTIRKGGSRCKGRPLSLRGSSRFSLPLGSNPTTPTPVPFHHIGEHEPQFPHMCPSICVLFGRRSRGRGLVVGSGWDGQWVGLPLRLGGRSRGRERKRRRGNQSVTDRVRTQDLGGAAGWVTDASRPEAREKRVRSSTSLLTVGRGPCGRTV